MMDGQPNPYAPPAATPAQDPRAIAFSCPRCDVSASAAPNPQTCPSCGQLFTLVPGPAGDGSVVPPPPDASFQPVKVKSAGVLQYHQGEVGPYGITHGDLDPVIAQVQVGGQLVPYPSIVAFAVWRRIDWLRLVLTIIVLLPVTLLCVALCFSWLGAIVLVLLFGILTAWGLYSALASRKCFMRVSGLYAKVDIRFDQPFWRREAFLREALRRSGLDPQAVQMP